MKQYNENAESITIRFNSAVNGEEIELEVKEMPMADYLSETINGSENSIEEEFESEIDDHTYRVVVYKNTVEGNVEVFDDTDDSEIDDFEIEELINDDTDIEDEF